MEKGPWPVYTNQRKPPLKGWTVRDLSTESIKSWQWVTALVAGRFKGFQTFMESCLLTTSIIEGLKISKIPDLDVQKKKKRGAILELWKNNWRFWLNEAVITSFKPLTKPVGAFCENVKSKMYMWIFPFGWFGPWSTNVFHGEFKMGSHVRLLIFQSRNNVYLEKSLSEQTSKLKKDKDCLCLIIKEKQCFNENLTRYNSIQSLGESSFR